MLALPRKTRYFLSLFACLAMLAAGGTWAVAADKEARPTGAATWPQVTAWLRDGTRHTGTKVDKLSDESGPTLDGKPLGNKDNPVRTIRWRAAVVPRGPAVELAGGDLLPGTIFAHHPATPELPAHFVIAPAAAVAIAASKKDAPSAGFPRVREAAVRRILRSTAAERPFASGRLTMTDGRMLQARSVRFAGDHVQLFTTEGIKRIEFAEIAEFDLPQRDQLADVLADGVWWKPDGPGSLFRVRTTGGSQWTFDRRLCQAEGTGFLVRPAWSLQTLLLPAEELAWITLRAGNEVPLSLLPAEIPAAEDASATLWRRNANVGGGELRAGQLAAEIGLGMQAPAALAWNLPPGAEKFSAAVGLSEAVGDGGCVRCKVRLDAANASPLWQSGFLRGGDQPVKIGPLDVRGARKLLLSADMAHAGRPAGADPLAIRDHVDWLDPLVTVDPASLPNPVDDLGRWIGQLSGWKVSEKDRARIEVRPSWNKYTSSWEFVLAAAQRDAEPLELERRIRVSLANSRLVIVAANDGDGSGGYEIKVLADGQFCEATLNGNINTSGTAWKRPEGREHNLGEWIDHEVTLKLVLDDSGSKLKQPTGLVWQSLALLPLIENLPDDAQPLVPDVLLTSLTPLETKLSGKPKPLKLQAGELPTGKPLTIRGARFAQGFAVPTGAELTYALDPAWTRLVAVIGLADGWQGAGPYEVLLDGQPYWKSAKAFDRNSPGLQVDLPIPAGYKKITLRTLGRECAGAWANAGFQTR